jgi:hypothetical protein
MKTFFSTLAAILVAAALMLLIANQIEQEKRIAALRTENVMLEEMTRKLNDENTHCIAQILSMHKALREADIREADRREAAIHRSPQPTPTPKP